MLRLYRLTLALVLLSTALIVGVQIVGHSRPSPLLPLFSAADGAPCARPCVFGLRPGETTGMVTAIEYPILRTFVATWASQPLHSHLVGTSGISIEVQESELPDSTLLLHSITLSEYIHVAGPKKGRGTSISPFLPEIVSVGDVLSLFGSPDAVWSVSDAFFLYFRSTKPIIIVRLKTDVDNHHFLATTPISDLSLFDMSLCQVSGTANFKPWLGFTSHQHYSQVQSFEVHSVRQTLDSFTTNVPCSL